MDVLGIDKAVAQAGDEARALATQLVSQTQAEGKVLLDYATATFSSKFQEAGKNLIDYAEAKLIAGRKVTIAGTTIVIE